MKRAADVNEPAAAAAVVDAVPARLRVGSDAFYPIRVVTLLGALVVVFLYTWHFSEFGKYSYFLAFFGVVYPHVMHFLQRRFEARRRIAHLTLILDAAFSGMAIYQLHFSFQASLAMAMIAIVTPIALTGLSMLPWTALALVCGALLPAWIMGMPPPAADYPLLDYMTGGFVMVFFALFGNAVYVRTRALQSSRKALRDQQLRTEIEKKRSDGLLGSILPPGAVRELHQSGAIGTQRRQCALCVVAIPALRTLDGAARDAQAGRGLSLEDAAELLGAIDAIGSRFHLEAVNSEFDLHVMVGGLDGKSASADDAAAAAREAADWVGHVNRSRRAAGQPAIDVGIATGAGELTLGAVQLRRMVYAVSGAPLFEAIDAARRNASSHDNAATPSR